MLPAAPWLLLQLLLPAAPWLLHMPLLGWAQSQAAKEQAAAAAAVAAVAAAADAVQHAAAAALLLQRAVQPLRTKILCLLQLSCPGCLLLLLPDLPGATAAAAAAE